MEQRSNTRVERRNDTRQPKAFAFWIRPEPGRQRISAWMLDVSAGGAAFLTAAPTAPPIGRRLELIEMQAQDPLVREGAGPLPTFARVLRHDDSDGVTQRIALRFEADERTPVRAPGHRTAGASCRQTRVAPPLPPALAADPYGRIVAPSDPLKN